MRAHRLAAYLLAFLVGACGGGGGEAPGGGPPIPIALGTIDTTLSIPGTGDASVQIAVRSDGQLDWAAAVPPAVAADVTAIEVVRGTLAGDTTFVIDLLGGAAPFDPGTGSAAGTASVTESDAQALAGEPGEFFITLRITNEAPVNAALGAFAPIEWHTVLLGTNETTVEDDTARGAATFRLDDPSSVRYVIAMAQPAVTDLIGAHIHVGAAGANGVIVLDLAISSGAVNVGEGTVSGTVPIDAETLARIRANLGGFYCNVHTSAAPNGVARGQLGMGGVEFWAALKGDQETQVIDGDARGGFFLELDSFTTGLATLAVPADTQAIDDLNAAHIHDGGPGVNGLVVIDLRAGPDYNTSPETGSADGSVSLTQALFARLLANPHAFYVNFHTAAAPNGLVRAQLTTSPVTFFAALDGANETTPQPGAGGALTVVFAQIHRCSYTITMQTPAAADLTAAHIHDGPAGVDGPFLVDLLGGGFSLAGNVITGTAAAPGRTFARMLASPELFYGNVHTVAAPNGVARGQFTQVSGDTPPAGLAYTTPVTYQTASQITPNAPTSVGGAITGYSISPALSAGLSIDASTGIISGTPTATRPATDYTVTASNDAGSTAATVNITVNVGPPTSLSYTTPVTYTVGTLITPNSPTSAGGQIASYSVNPALPGGLSLNTGTGVITGTPTTPATAANYTVTGTNAAGTVQATINITVQSNLQPPSNLSYTTPVTYSTGFAITANQPTVTGSVANWGVNPALPAGLTLNSGTGVISGTPTTVTAAANYTVTASNAAGSTQATVNITVVLGKPGSFTYSNDPNLGYANTPIPTMSPSHNGGGPVASYSISPGLLAGLSLNTTTGVISGTPTATDIPGTTYTVTATNAAGSTTSTVTIQVLP